MTRSSEQDYVGRFWRSLAGQQIVCELCPRSCSLSDGQKGFCFVRQNRGGRLILTTYGLSSGFCIDPIEKKPLNHFFPGSGILSFGTAGCNLGCQFCQNWSISKCQEFDRLTDQASPEEIAKRAKELGCTSVAFTYNEPIVFAEYAIDVAKACQELNIHTVAVTAGYMTEQVHREFFQDMDAANVDLKAFSEEFYRKKTGGHLQPVLKTLNYLKKETQVWLEITNLLIPGENDSGDEIRAMCEWVFKNLGPDVPLHFSAFHPAFKMLDHAATPPETLQMARQIAMKEGLHFVYTGNVRDEHSQSTTCPNCGQLLIVRDGYELGEYNLTGNKCKFCGAVCPGLFAQGPGDWGSKCLPISFA